MICFNIIVILLSQQYTFSGNMESITTPLLAQSTAPPGGETTQAIQEPPGVETTKVIQEPPGGATMQNGIGGNTSSSKQANGKLSGMDFSNFF